MTNEEWLNTLSIEKKAKIFAKFCNLCIYGSSDKDCLENVCENGIKEWLKKEHKEPIPTLKAGDIVQTKPYCRYVAIDSIILVRAENKERVFLCDIGNIVQVWRSEGAEYQCIWRADRIR